MSSVIRNTIRIFGLVIILSPNFVFAQQNGRFAALKEKGLQAFDRADYNQVAGALEEIWEQDQSDPKVAEYLAMGYLYGQTTTEKEKNAAKAEPIMAAALRLKGQATFLVQHSHERGGTFLSGGTIANYCTGRISIVPGKMTFLATSGDHSATYTAADIADLHAFKNGNPGRIQLKSGKNTVVYRVKTWTNSEADLLVRIAQQNLNAPQAQ